MTLKLFEERFAVVLQILKSLYALGKMFSER
mgnify:CR=1 FL=1